MKNRTWLFPLCAALTAMNIFAQTPEATRTVQFMLFSESDTSVGMSENAAARSSVIPRIRFSLLNSSEPTVVDVPASGFRGPFTAKIFGDQLSLYRTGPLNLESLTPADRLATINVPPEWSDLILYAFYSLKEESARFLLLSDISQLEAGQSTFCMNMTGKPIAVNIGDERFILKPYERAHVDLSDANGSELISIKVAAEWKENWRLALSTTRRLRPDDGHILMFKAVPSNPRSMSLRVVRIPELPTNPDVSSQ